MRLHVADGSGALVLRFKLPLSHVVRDFLAGALLQAALSPQEIALRLGYACTATFAARSHAGMA